MNIAWKDTQNLADKIAYEQQSMIAGARQLMVSLSQMPEIKQKDAAKVTPLLTKIHQLNPDLTNIFVADRTGNVWATAVPVKPPFIISDRRYFKNALASGQLSSGEYVVSRAINRPAFNLSYPLKDEQGEIIGVIAVGFSLEKYTQLLERSKLPKNASFVLLDHKGVFLFRAIEPEKFIGKQSDPALFKQIQEEPDENTSVGIGVSLGDKRILSVKKLRLAGETSPYMYVRVGIPVESALAHANSQLLRNLIFLSGVLVLAYLFASFISERSIVSRITLLGKASQSLANGDYQVKVSDLVVGGELGSLGQTFDNMAQQLALREKALRDSERNYREIFNAVKDAIFLHDAESGKIVEVNKTVEEMFGYSCEEILHVTIQEISSGEPPHTLADARKWIRKTCMEGPQSFEWLYKRKNGERFWAEVIMSDTRIGGEGRVLAVVRDIAERKKAEEELQKSEERLSRAQAIAHVGDWEWDIATNVVHWSDELYQIYGFRSREIAPDYGLVLQQMHPDSRDAFLMAIDGALTEDRHFELDYRFFRKDGSEAALHTIGHLFRDPSGAPMRMVGIVQDITERVEGELRLRESEDKFRSIFEQATDGIMIADAESKKQIDANVAMCAMLGYTRDEIIGLGIEDIHPIKDLPAVRGLFDKQVRGEISLAPDVPMLRKDGSVLYADVNAARVTLGGKECLVGVFRDTTEHKKADEEQQKLASLVENSTDFIGIATLAGEFFYINKAGQKMLGMEEAAGTEGVRMTVRFGAEDRQNLSELLTAILERGNWTGEFRFRNQKTGVSIPVDLNGFLITNRKTGEPLALATVSRDITERKRHEAQLLYQATYDILTGLPNRNLLNDRFTQAIAIENRHHNFLCLMLMDLDNFKIVNDTLGHAVGDVLLQDVAGRIQAIVRKSDTVARLGGDEFVVVPVNISSSQDAAKVAEQILTTLSRPFSIDGREIFLTVSIGIAIYPHDGDSLDHLLKHADVAMYHAKSLGKNNYQFFTAEINNRIHERLAMETLLRRALERDEYLLHYQPMVDLKSGRVVGVEALLRWQPEGEGLLFPDRFIPLLEETGLIIPVGEWVLRTACSQLHEWCQAGHDLRLSVNISSRQFRSGTITERIIEIVRDSGCSPGQICLELTESIIMHDSDEIIQKLVLLREMGFSLSIDDFGTGFSSLSYLKRLPIAELKIDKTFVSGLPANVSDTAIVTTIIHMAGSLQMNVVAEGVETAEQLRFLSENGCSRAQGHYFSRPLPPDEFVVSLQRSEMGTELPD
jgi:diguanylate cyclase (GGDEF)-like protein/PAS domain S-box-containing protein